MVRKLNESIDIISPRHRETVTDYSLTFTVVGQPRGNGMAFPCDKDGNVLIDEMTPEAKRNYEYCLEHPEHYEEPYVRTERYSYMENAVAKCICGKEIELYDEYMGACECPYCGRWYNMFGQELQNPYKWEEEHYEELPYWEYY